MDSVTIRGRTISGFRELAPPAGLSLQRAMLDAASDCGCEAGTTAAAVMLSAYLIVDGVLPWSMGLPIGLTWVGGTLVGLGAGIIGKVVGLKLADRRLQSCIRQFETSLKQQAVLKIQL